MKNKILTGIFIFISLIPIRGLKAQSPDSLSASLEMVIVHSFRPEHFRETSMMISKIRFDSLLFSGGMHITDKLTLIPGIQQLSTGSGISKPVIRGLYGNRLTILQNGIRFDNQQWQEEHGLGLSDFGLGGAEITRGPLSVLYGSEAVGGVIRFLEEAKPIAGSTLTDFNIRINTNTLGAFVQAGYYKNEGNKWFRVRIGSESNSDYSDGKKSRVLNSRFDGYYFKTSMGFIRKKWLSENTFSSGFNRFGFIFQDMYSFVTPDNRWSRSLSENPCHLVLINRLTSENSVQINQKTSFHLTGGITSNRRMENEGGGQISLDMHLLTGEVNGRIERRIGKKQKLIGSLITTVGSNMNYGGRKLIPDATTFENTLAVYHELNTRVITFENSLGVGQKSVSTYLTPGINDAGHLFKPFSIYRPYSNFFSGVTIRPTEKWVIKVNASTGIRIPNLAELSSNGLHEGVYIFEIGNPSMKNERNFCFNTEVNYHSERWYVQLTGFYNRFTDFIYLAPVNEVWNGFPVSRYLQQNVIQSGAEGVLGFHYRKADLRVTGSGLAFKGENGMALPYTPASKLKPMVMISGLTFSGLLVSGNLAAEYTFKQTHVYINEPVTPSYWLLMGSVSVKQASGGKWEFVLNGTNLLNKYYTDHLSRLKYMGIANMGRNVQVSFRWKISGKI